MKKQRFLIAVFVSLIFFGTAQVSAIAAEIREIVTPGGIKAWLVEERSIPIVSMKVAWLGGASLDPADRAGIAHLASATMDEGAGDLDSISFQERLSDLAIKLNFDAGKDTFSGNLKTLSENTDEAFRLFGLAITEPRFDDEPVERIRAQILTSLNRKLSDPNSLAGRAWFDIAFKGHPYSQPSEGTIDTMSAVTKADLIEFAKTRLAKDNMVISVVGDIGEDELMLLLDKTFGGLPEKAMASKIPETSPIAEATVKIIDQDIPQSIVIFGGQGIKRDDPDYYAAYVLNYILGGSGFESRLTDEIREKRGLVYSVYSYLYPLESAALQMGGFGTSNASVKEALELVSEQVAEIRTEGVTADELAGAKTYLNGSFPLSLSSNASIASIMVAMQLNELPTEYLQQRADLINAVTLDDVKRVSQRLLDPEKMIVVVVGKPVDLEAKGAGIMSQ
ncbi:insulinase family protein [Sneathiella marina]|uniref:Insulinase family protein n=1 Tax=Sneathiella marina TaxID=2950108 RepID=A0ABY4W880_9PROT|nr:pitrilysin family protein [Sneathiella marina]USG62132.1 insulinase family protein [Sneathiella marina]